MHLIFIPDSSNVTVNYQKQNFTDLQKTVYLGLEGDENKVVFGLKQTPDWGCCHFAGRCSSAFCDITKCFPKLRGKQEICNFLGVQAGDTVNY